MDEIVNQPAGAVAKRGGKLRRIFIGRDGLRAAWRALLFAAIFAGTIYGLGHIAKHFVPKVDRAATMPVGAALVMEGVQLAAVLIATAVVAAIEGKSFFAYGLQGSARGIRFVSGLVCGFAAISVLVLALRQAGLLQLDASGMDAAQAWRSAGLWAILFVMVGVFEEMVLRGYLQYVLARAMGFWWAALLLSVAFGAAHGVNPGETPVGLFQAMVAGLLLCLTLWLTGSLWWAIGFHAAWDWGESYFYGTADSGEVVQGALFKAHPIGNVFWSGGATGPEGSLLCLVVLGAVALLAWAWWRREPLKRQSEARWSAR